MVLKLNMLILNCCVKFSDLHSVPDVFDTKLGKQTMNIKIFFCPELPGFVVSSVEHQLYEVPQPHHPVCVALLTVAEFRLYCWDSTGLL